MGRPTPLFLLEQDMGEEVFDVNGRICLIYMRVAKYTVIFWELLLKCKYERSINVIFRKYDTHKFLLTQISIHQT